MWNTQGKNAEWYNLLDWNVGDLSCRELTEFIDLVLEVIDPLLESTDNHVLLLQLFSHIMDVLSQGFV